MKQKNGTGRAMRWVMLAPRLAIWLWNKYARKVRLVHRSVFMIVIIAITPPARRDCDPFRVAGIPRRESPRAVTAPLIAIPTVAVA